MSDVQVRSLESGDADWLETVLREVTAGPSMVSRGVLHDGLSLPGVVAVLDDERVGVALYRIDDVECELVFVAATKARVGAGRALLGAVADLARRAGCRRAWVITTNDNTPAIHFYQRCGWDLVAFHRDALRTSRSIKPAIPLAGHDGIPIRHELEFELQLPADGT